MHLNLLKADEDFLCPCCLKKQEAPVGDYVPEGRVGASRRDLCGWCNVPFIVKCEDTDQFSVKKA